MLRTLYWVILNIIAMWVAVLLVPGIRAPHVTDILWAGVMLALVNGILGPIVRLLTCPLRLISLGIFSLVVNWLLFLFAAWLSRRVGASIVITSMWAALAGAIVVSIVTFIGQRLVFAREEKRSSRD